MSVELAVQVALRTRFSSASNVTSLVPASHILDRNGRPAAMPSIILGEDQAIDEGDAMDRRRLRIYSTVHVWKREESLAGVKAIAWALRVALRQGRLDLGPGFHCIDCKISSQRFLRDPDGETAHGVVTFDSLVEEV